MLLILQNFSNSVFLKSVLYQYFQIPVHLTRQNIYVYINRHSMAQLAEHPLMH